MKTRAGCGVLVVLCGLVACDGAGGDPPDGAVVASGVSSFELLSTDAVVGGRGRLRVTLDQAVSEATTIELRSDAATVAAVPATVEVPEGAQVVELTYEGEAVGDAVITARLGERAHTTTVSVVSSIQVSSLSATSVLQSGAINAISVSLNVTASDDVSVTLSSSDPTVIAVPTTVIVPAFTGSVPLSVEAQAAGSTVITAIPTEGGNPVARVISVVDDPLLDNVSISSRVQVGGVASLFVSVNAVLASELTVELSSSDPSVAAVPSVAQLLAGHYYVSIPVVVTDAGTTTITARVGDQERSATLQGVADLSIISASLNPSTTLSGQPVALSVVLDAVSAVDRSIALTIDPATSLAAPATVTVPAGDDRVTAMLVAGDPGSGVLTVALGPSSRALGLQVVNGLDLSTFSTSTRVLTGSANNLAVYLNAPAATATQVPLSSSDPDVISVPEVARFEVGERYLSLPLVAHGVGTTTLTATLDERVRTITVEVVDGVSLQSTSATARMIVGQAGMFYVTLTDTPGEEVPLALTSSSPAVIALPAAVPTYDRTTQIPFTALSAGTTTLTASFGGTTLTEEVTVVDAPSLTSLSVPGTMLTGAVSRMFVRLDVAPTSDLTVSLTSTDAAAVRVPASVTIPAGSVTAEVEVEALATGSAIVTATTGGSSYAVTVTVVGMAQLSYISGIGTYQTGAVSSGSIGLTAAVAEDTWVTLSSSDPAVVSTPDRVLVSAGRSNATFVFQALAEGSTTVSASVGGVTRAMTVTVLDTPTLTLSVSSTANVGSPRPVSVSFDAALAADALVTISNDAPAAFPVPTTLVVPAGRSSVATDVIPTAAGTATISASWEGQSTSPRVIVVSE